MRISLLFFTRTRKYSISDEKLENEFDPLASVRKYLRGECNPEELRQVARYLKEQENEAELLRWMENDWETAAPDQVLDEARSGAILENILGRPAPPAPEQRPATGRYAALKAYWPAAAAVLLLLAAAGLRAVRKVRNGYRRRPPK